MPSLVSIDPIHMVAEFDSGENAVLQSAREVMERAREVSIDASGVHAFCRSFDPTRMRHWLQLGPIRFQEFTPRERVPFLFVLDSISFCYWGDPKWHIDAGDSQYDGTWALSFCLDRALRRGIPLLDPHHLADITVAQFASMTRGNVAIPLLEARVRILNELGATILDEYAGRFESVLEAGRWNSLGIADTLCRSFPSMRDEAGYDSRRVVFNKRAQLLAADLWYESRLPQRKALRPRISGRDQLTACADYKLPQVLRRLKVLTVSENLQQRIARHEEIHSGAPQEVELRAATIMAVEQIRVGLSAKYPNLTANEVNDYLWLLGQQRHPEDPPYHRTLTTSY